MSITDLKYRVHFGATLTVGEFMIAEPLSHSWRHPDSDLSVTVANTELLLQKLDAGEIDFAILEGNYPRHLYRHVPMPTNASFPSAGNATYSKRRPEVFWIWLRNVFLSGNPAPAPAGSWRMPWPNMTLVLKIFSTLPPW